MKKKLKSTLVYTIKLKQEFKNKNAITGFCINMTNKVLSFNFLILCIFG